MNEMSAVGRWIGLLWLMSAGGLVAAFIFGPILFGYLVMFALSVAAVTVSWLWEQVCAAPRRVWKGCLFFYSILISHMSRRGESCREG